MSDEKIEVEWIATAQQMLSTIQKIDQKMVKQEQLMQKLGDSSKKSAEGAAGSFNKLEKELKDNEAQLKRLAMGTKEFDAQRKKVDMLRSSLKGAKGELTQIGGSTGGLLQSSIAKVGALAAGMVGFQQVVTAITAELEKVKTLKLEAAATTRTFEQALADVGQNIGAEAVPEARKMILEQAPKLGVTQEGLANILGVAISAGAKDLKEAMELSAAALKLTVGDANKAVALVGSTLDVASLGGSKNFEGALGQLLQTQSQVRSTNLSEFGANIGPGLAAATSQGTHQEGVSTERAFEMASTISQIIKDQTGANTATTMRQMFIRMDSFVPEKSVKLDDGGTAKVDKKNIDEFKAAKTFDERLELMRKVPAIAQQFLETQRESIGKTAVREIVTGSERAVAFEEKAKQAITPIDQSQEFFKKLENTLVGETAQLTAERKAQANIQTAEVSGNRDVEGAVQKIVDDTLEKVNLSGLDYDTSKKIKAGLMLDNATGVEPVQAGINALEEAKGRRAAFGVIPAGGAVSKEDTAL
ncbi:MAG TPA: hypothetical protein PK992_10545, partial [Planctomycetaceae bacterium]|nr:hypothetical protein [Planctomycetaceae bacterium]